MDKIYGLRGHTNLTELFLRCQAIEDKGVTFIYGAENEVFLPYSQLYRETQTILCQLQRRGLRPQDEVMILMEDSRNFIPVFWACILGGMVPVVTPPGITEEERGMLEQVCRILRKPTIITTEEMLAREQFFLYHVADYELLMKLDNCTVTYEELASVDGGGLGVQSKAVASPGEVYAAEPDDLLAVMFSSGSTGEPKGIIDTHRNVLADIAGAVEGARLRTEDVYLNWAPLTHAFGLMACHIVPVLLQCQQYQMAKEVFVNEPMLWFQKAHEHGATILASPNFGYKHFLNCFDADRADGWDLSSVRLIFNAAEPISVALCKEFLTTMARYNLRWESMLPFYGMTETCMMISLSSPEEGFRYVSLDRRSLTIGQMVREVPEDDAHAALFVDVGTPISGCEVRITDDEGELLPENTVGHVETRGQHITPGYYANAEATRKTFTVDGWLKTGDIGFLEAGRLVIAGRAKDVIFVNGVNYFPHDIERVAREVEGFAEGQIAVCGLTDDAEQGEKIVGFAVTELSLEEFAPLALEMKKHIGRKMGLKVAEIIPVDELPKTRSGKLQRYKLGEAYKAGEFAELIARCRALTVEQSDMGEEIPLAGVARQLLTICAQVLGVERLDRDEKFYEICADSLKMIQLTGRLNQEFGIALSVADVFKFNTVSEIAAFLEEKQGQTQVTPEVRAVLDGAEVAAKGNCDSANQGNDCLEHSYENHDYRDSDIAIIGMAGRFPEAENLEEFWTNLVNERSSIRAYPEKRMAELQEIFGPLTERGDILAQGYLEEVTAFEPEIFGLNAEESRYLDPQQRLLLELVEEAILDAGYKPGILAGREVGVFLSANDNEYGRHIDSSSMLAFVNSVTASNAARVAYVYDFCGPVLSVDTACSSSLTALHVACQNIRAGEAEYALAGGVQMRFLPPTTRDLERNLTLSRNDLVKAFAADADGTVDGEGGGIVLLKSLPKALADGDNIRAIIKGSALNNNGGKSNGLNAPSEVGQADAILKAIKKAGIDPLSISYVETHGTGTKIGDPIEIAGLTAAFNQLGYAKRIVPVGSLKTNIGHLIGASGIANVIKTVLSLEHRKIPASLNFTAANPFIDFSNAPVYVNAQLVDWQSDSIRRAGVTSLGLTGTNVHIILEEAPPRRASQDSFEEKCGACTGQDVILTLSARREKSLRQMVNRLGNYLANHLEISILDVAYTLNTGRREFDHKLRISASSTAELVAKIQRGEYELVSDSGENADWPAAYTGEMGRKVSLPGYIFDRASYFVEGMRRPDIFAETNSQSREGTVCNSEWRVFGNPTESQNEISQQYIAGIDGVGGEATQSRPQAPGRVRERITALFRGLYSGADFDLNCQFFDSGINSIAIIHLIGKIKQEFGVEMQVAQFFDDITLGELIDRVQLFINCERGEEVCISRQPVRELYPASAVQKRLFVINQFGNDLSYNMPVMLKGQGKLDIARFSQAFQRVVERHEALRTSFELADGELRQRVHPAVDCTVPYLEVNAETLSTEQIELAIAEFIQPFDLRQAPLFRAQVLGNGAEHLLMLDVHHIISDGVSTDILFKELAAFYASKDLPEPAWQYRDFAIWQGEFQHSVQVRKQEEYWLNTFAGEIPVLNLPLDYQRPATWQAAGDTCIFRLEREKTARLNRFAADHGVTPYMALLALFNVTLARYSGQADIVVGSPITGRRYADLQGIFGMFVNTLALRNYPALEKPFDAFLAEVKTTALAAFENQDYQFEELVDRLALPRDLSRNPLFDVVFVLQNANDFTLQLGEASFGFYQFPVKAAKFDLTLSAYPVEGELRFSLEYCTRLFAAETLERFARHFLNIIDAVLAEPALPLGQLPMLTLEEKAQILHEFNATQAEYPYRATVVQLFEEQVLRSPETTALTSQGESWSYRALNAEANRVANYLQKKGVQAEEIVGVLTGSSLEMFAAIFGVLKAGGAYLPLDPDYPAERLEFMLRDSGARMLLTQRAELGQVHFAGEIVEISQLRTQGELSEPSLTCMPENLAYVIYTSGSSGQPKGVMVEHRSLVNLVCWHNRYYGVTSLDRATKFAGPGFDASVWEIFPYLVAGATIHLLDEETRLNVKKLNDYFEQHNITISFLPTGFAEQFLEAENHSLRYLLTGGDKLKVYRERQYRLVNNYGPTENTVVTTSFIVDGAYENIPIGEPIANTQVLILDSEENLQPIGVPGELCISGEGLARGYLHNPALTAERFLANPYIAGARMYRTGDLARWRSDGKIEFLGRIDQQVKIRGYRIELGEIENRILAYPGVRETAVIDRVDQNGDKYLSAYLVLDADGADADELVDLRSFLAGYLPEYMIPTYFLQVDNLPLNANGKLDRRALPEPAYTKESHREWIAPQTEIEVKMAQLWVEVLGVSEVGLQDNFFEIGGHSLRATQLSARALKEFGAELPLQAIFHHRTLREMVDYLQVRVPDTGQSGEGNFTAIPLAGKRPYYPVSAAQKRLYLINELQEASTAYNMPIARIIEGPLDRARLMAAVEKLIERHGAFRTSFAVVDGELVQRVTSPEEYWKAQDNQLWGEFAERTSGKDNWLVNDEKGELSGQITHILAEFVRPFDLRQGPLIRVQLLPLTDERHLFLLDMHHVISDGVSMEIFFREMADLYATRPLSALHIQYTDFAVWQNDWLQSSAVKAQEQYWLEVFSGELPVLNLPTDFPRPAEQNFQGDTIHFTLNPEMTGRLYELAQSEEATVYMVLLAVFNIFLAKYSAQKDIIVGSPVAGRGHVDLEQTIGMFVNTLAMRNYPTPQKSFAEFLEEVTKSALQGFARQDYQFDMLVEKLELRRDASRNPLFDAMLVLQNENDWEGVHWPDLTWIPYPVDNRISKFDLLLNVREKSGSLEFELEYAKSLFKRETAERMARHLLNLLRQGLDNPEICLGAMSLVDVEEQAQILALFNATQTGARLQTTVHQLFVEQARRTPEQTALVFENTRLTYRELHERSNQLAHHLRRLGVRPDQIVAIMLERSMEMIIGLLGILKAGGAYLPVDPDWPERRVEDMLADVKPALVLKREQVEQALAEESTEDVPELASAENLVYLIHTSGSTGKPKSVMLEHRNLVNLLLHQYTATNIDFTGRVLQFTTLSFDVSFQEIFSTLLAGGELYLLTKEGRDNLPQLLDFISGNAIKTLFMPVAVVKFIFGDPELARRFPSNVRHIITAGEQLTVSARFREYLQAYGVHLHNHYGPSETHVVTTLTIAPENDIPETPTIGRPIANTQIYIVPPHEENTSTKDQSQLQLQPIGVPGEIWIGGVSVGRGYLNRPELTAEKYLANPFRTNERVYRTGDLGKWLADGTIQFLGRMDHQVKIRGYRIELGEIENVLLCHSLVKDAAVIVRENSVGEKYLCAYFEPQLHTKDDAYQENPANYIDSSSKVDPTDDGVASSTIQHEIKQYLAERLPDYMVPAYFITLERLPLNVNGKVDREALSKLEVEYLSGSENYQAPETAGEAKMAQLWAELLGLERVGVSDNFFEIGGHSLKATQLVARIARDFGVEVPVKVIFRAKTVRELVAYVESRGGNAFAAITPVAEADYYPASSAQQRLYIINSLADVGVAYNLPYATMLLGKLDRERFESALRVMIGRHDSFRTSFTMIEGEVVQIIHQPTDTAIINWQMEVEESSTASFAQATGTGQSATAKFERSAETEQYSEAWLEQVAREFLRPFDLSMAPLFRAKLIECSPDQHVFLFDMHHIITDGISMEIFLQELNQLYAGEDLVELGVQYKDYTYWQKQLLQSQQMQKQEEYWQKTMNGEIPVLNLPLDFSRPLERSFAGDWYGFQLDAATSEGIKELAVSHGVTLYMALLACFDVLLMRYSGQEDVIVGSPVAGRRHADLENVIGLFVNTLAMRNRPERAKTFAEFLAEVKVNALEAYDHQDYQFETLVEKLALERDLSRNALFDVMFVLQNSGLSGAARDVKTGERGVSFTLHPFNYRMSKMDLTLGAYEDGEKICFNLEYATGLFQKETVARMAGHLLNLIIAVIANPAQRLGELEILSQKEKSLLVETFNSTQADYPFELTIVQLFEEAVRKNPDGVALVSGNETWTYQGLNRRANYLARILQKNGVGPETIVGLVFDRSPEMVASLLAILKAGGAYLPIAYNLPAARMQFMLKECTVQIVLTLRKLTELENAGQSTALQSIFDGEIIYVDDLPGDLTDDLEPMYTPDNLAYVIYTSGTTGKPKGVMVEHRGVLNTICWRCREFPMQFTDGMLVTFSFTFDGFVISLFTPLTQGARAILVQDDETADPVALRKYIVQEGVTHLLMVPSLYVALLDFLSFEDTVKLRVVTLAAEKLMPEMLQQCKSLNPTLEIANEYGPTECSISATLKRDLGVRETVSIGRPIANTQVFILDQENHLQPVGVPGELCIAGRGLTRGYLARPELTAEKFVPHPFEAGQLMYRTGDLARWLADGNIEYLGRIDQQVKIRGFRIETGEIENHLLKHPAIKESVVLAKTRANGDSYLIAYLVSLQPIAVAEIKNWLAEQVPDYMIPAHFYFLEKMPVNSSGKLDRQALLQMMDSLPVERRYSAPETEREREMAELWAELLGVAQVGIDDNFFEIGGHSLKATQLVARICKAFGVQIPVKEIFRAKTVQNLVKNMQAVAGEGYHPLTSAPHQAYYPASSAEKRLFAIDSIDNAGIAYNMPCVMTVAGQLDYGRLEQALIALLMRHESLRTHFALADGEVVQIIADGESLSGEMAGWRLEVAAGLSPRATYHDIDRPLQPELERVIREFIRPFDLGRGPLFRAKVVPLGEEQHLFMLDMHHIISDGISLEIILRELGRLYGGEELPDLRVQYKDFTLWQNALLESEELHSQEEYWVQAFAGEIPVLNLSTDFPRAMEKSFAGDQVDFALPEELSASVHQLADQHGATLYMVLLAAFNVFLMKYSGQEDIVVGSPTAGRRHADLENIVGMFVNTLALRNYPAKNKSLAELLTEVKENALNAFEHQDYQFEMLVEKLSLKRDLSRNALFDVMFVLQNQGQVGFQSDEVQFSVYPVKYQLAKFDLTLAAYEDGGRIHFNLEYSTALFRSETVRRMAEHLTQLIAALVAEPAMPLGKLEMITPMEKAEILGLFNATAVEYPADLTMVQLFEESVRQYPDCLALVSAERTLTYRELNARANQVAWALREKGVRPDEVVGLVFDRSPEMVIGLLGILKSGGAYLPIARDFPATRVKFMLENCHVRLVLTNEDAVETRGLAREAIYLQEIGTEYRGGGIVLPGTLTNQDVQANPPHIHSPENLAYVIYTSGTTGQPKGVMVQHSGIANTIAWRRTEFPMAPGDSQLITFAFTFDGFVTSLFTPLTQGARGVLLAEGEVGDPVVLREYIVREKVSHLLTVPSLYGAMLDFLKAEELAYLSVVTLAGEELVSELVERSKLLNPAIEIVNEYGPTECSVSATVERNLKASEAVSIGRPISNTRAYILDDENLQPIGLPGELCIAGRGVARGYLSEPELTAARFIPDPFKPHEMLYRTGDLARWLPDGKIDFLGRIDQQVKIRGYRIEPAEIEVRLLRHPPIQQVVVLARETAQGASLLAYFVATQSLDLAALRDELAKDLPEYMIPTIILQIPAIPLTANGKIDRKALLALQDDRLTSEKTGVPYLAPATVVEMKLAKIWSDILGVGPVSVTDSFFDLGGDSIKAIQVLARASEAGLTLTVKDIFKYKTIAHLVKNVNLTTPPRSISQAEVSGQVLLTPIQKWFWSQEHTCPGYFNQTNMFTLLPGVDLNLLEQALLKLIDQHDALRMTYQWGTEKQASEIVQFNRRTQEVEFTLARIDLTHLDYATQERELRQMSEAMQNFDLTQDLLFKAAVFDLGEQGLRLLIAIHHLVIDGVSWRILVEDLERLYHSKLTCKLPAKTTSFQEWSQRLNDYAKTEELNLTYWQQIDPAQLQSLMGATLSANLRAEHKTSLIELSEAETSQLLTGVNQAYNTEINDILLTALLLSCTETFGMQNLLINLEGHGREEIFPEVELSRTIGWFTCAYPIYLESQANLSETLIHVKENLRRVPDKGLPYGLARYIKGNIMQEHGLPGSGQVQQNSILRESHWLGELNPEVSFNYLGQFDLTTSRDSAPNEPLLTNCQENAGESISPANQAHYLLDINGAIIGGRLQLSLSYHVSALLGDTVERLGASLVQKLAGIIEHCMAKEGTTFTASDFGAGDLLSETAFTDLANELRHEDIECDPAKVKIYGLTPMQEGMLFHSLFNETGNNYYEQTLFEMKGEVDFELLKAAWAEVVQRFDVFCTRFSWENTEKFIQLVLPKGEAHIRLHDLSGLSVAEEEAFIQEFTARDLAERFDFARGALTRFTLLKLSGERALLCWTFHHILLDGWSAQMVLGELLKIYSALRLRKPLPPATAVQFKQYVDWLKAQNHREARRFWANYLAELASPTLMVTERQGSADETITRVLMTDVILSVDETLAVNDLCRRAGVTPNAFVQTAWAILLHKYTNTAQVCFGTTVSGRPGSLKNVQEIVGNLINTIPVVVESTNRTIRELLEQVQHTLVEIREYEFMPLTEIQKLHGAGQKLFDSITVFENFPLNQAPEADTGFTLEIKSAHELTNYDIGLVAALYDRLIFRLAHNAELFSALMIERTRGHLVQIIHAMLENENQLVSAINILSEAEKHDLLHRFNATHVGDGRAMPTITELFEAQVVETPEAIALTCGEESLTYRELNARADQLADLLRASILADSEGLASENDVRASQPDCIVAILVERSIHMAQGFLAILKASCAFLPIDPAYPEARIAHMLEDSGTQLLLTQKHLMGQVNFAGKILIIDEAGIDCGNQLARSDDLNINQSQLVAHSKPHTRSRGQDLAYVIYTSGTTGQPKGVMVEHRGISNTICWRRNEFLMQPGDSTLLTLSFAFDGFIVSFFTPLTQGARVVLVRDDEAKDPLALKGYFTEERITHFFTVPSLYSAILDVLTAEETENLHLITLAGEKLLPALVEKSKALNSAAEIVNEYGPTESSVTATVQRNLQPGHEITIGRPIANTRIYVLSESGLLQPVGKPGELCIAGAGLARGYLNRPALTEEKFVADPFMPGERMYKTGDLARWLEDGTLEFLGRVDHQLKIRGFRIEAGEVEAQLLTHVAIKEAHVMARTDSDGADYLCAYLVTRGEVLTPREIRAHLEERLPAYMIPARFVLLNQMPLTTSGKIDQRALPEPGLDALSGAEYVAPTKEHEKILAQIWAKTLGLQRVGVNDNFFELGGDSIKAIQIVSRALQQGITLKTDELFKYKTISGLVQNVDYRRYTPQIAQDPVEGEIPLTPVQHWFFEQEMSHPHYFNQTFMFTLPHKVDCSLLEESFKILLRHHDALRIGYRLMTVDRKEESTYLVEHTVTALPELRPLQVSQFNRGVDEVVFTLQRFDLAGEPYPEQQRKLCELSEKMQAGLDLENDLLLQAAIFDLGERGQRLWISVHHLNIDMVSWRILLEDLEALYTSRLSNPLPLKTTSYKVWSERLEEYAISSKNETAVDYWEKIDLSNLSSLANVQKFSKEKVRARFEELCEVSFQLNTKATEALLTKAGWAYNTEINDLLLTALTLTIYDMLKADAALIELEGHGREAIFQDVDISRTIGWFTSIFPVYFLRQPDLAAAIKHVKDTLRRIPHKGVDFGIARYLQKNTQTMRLNPEISFNYLGHLDLAQDGDKGIQELNGDDLAPTDKLLRECFEDAGASTHPANPYPSLLGIVAFTAHGIMSFSLRYLPTYLSEEWMQTFAVTYHRHLLTIIDHCTGQHNQSLTTSDFGVADILDSDDLEFMNNLLGD